MWEGNAPGNHTYISAPTYRLFIQDVLHFDQDFGQASVVLNNVFLAIFNKYAMQVFSLTIHRKDEGEYRQNCPQNTGLEWRAATTTKTLLRLNSAEFSRASFMPSSSWALVEIIAQAEENGGCHQSSPRHIPLSSYHPWGTKILIFTWKIIKI